MHSLDNRSFLELVGQALPDMVLVHDLAGRIYDANPKACEYLQYTRDALLSLSMADIQTDADLQHACWASTQSTSTTQINTRYRCREGHLLPVIVTLGLVQKDAEALYISVARLQTQAQRQDLEMVHSERGFHSLFNSMREGFCLHQIICDADGKPYDILHLLANEAYGRHTGKSASEVVGRRVRELYPDIDPSWIERYGAVALTGKAERFEGRFGPLQRWFDVSAYQTEPGFFALVFSDITERKQIEEHLQQQAMVFQSTEEGIVITDTNGHVVNANPAFERISEYPLSEILGKNMNFLHSGRQDQAFYQAMWAQLLKEGHWHGEIWNRRKGGEIYLEWISISAIRNKVGEVVNYVGTSIDINRMKHAQSELERLAHHDGLTALPNRQNMLVRLSNALSRSKRNKVQGAILFFDLDRFKAINDTYGHKIGDELLIAVAQRVRGRLRETDLLARLGGDEFVIILEDISAREDVARIAQNILHALHEPFPLPSGIEAHIGGSMGIAHFPEQGTVTEDLLELADQALYDAKRDGRGKVKVALKVA